MVTSDDNAKQAIEYFEKAKQLHLEDDDLLQFDVQFLDLQLNDQQAETQLAQQLMLGRPYLDS